MTRVTLREYYDRTLIIIEGHSDYSEKGKDIVCAGVSVLIFTLINCLLDEEAEGNIVLKRSIIRDGYVCFEIEKTDFSEERIKGMLSFATEGFFMLSESYPQYVAME